MIASLEESLKRAARGDKPRAQVVFLPQVLLPPKRSLSKGIKKCVYFEEIQNPSNRYGHASRGSWRAVTPRCPKKTEKSSCLRLWSKEEHTTTKKKMGDKQEHIFIRRDAFDCVQADDSHSGTSECSSGCAASPVCANAERSGTRCSAGFALVLATGDSVRTEPVPGAKDDAPTVPIPSL